MCQRRSLENPTKKLLRNNLWGKIKKKRLDGRRLPTNIDRRPTIRNKIHKNESKLLKQNIQGGKRNIAICDTISTVNVYYKGSLNNKNGILYKTNHNFKKCLRNHQSFRYKKGKSLKDMLVRAKKKKLRPYRCMCGLSPVAFSRTTGLWVF